MQVIQQLKHIMWAGLSLWLTACGGIQYMGIETRNPGEVTFPREVRKVLMVNNAAPQPEKSGYTYRLMGVVQDTARVQADSALFDVCTSCGLAILDADYFDDVLLFHESVRDSSLLFVKDSRLTQPQVIALCEANGADAVISLDKMLFSMDREVTGLGAGFVDGTIKVHMNGILRAYLPTQEKPLATVLVKDSVEVHQAAESLEILDFYLPNANDALRLAGDYLGRQVASYFVPHWSEETRWYFSSSNSRWKEAAAYASANRWEQAAQLWSALYRSNTSEKARAELASNLALACEMQNNLPKAREWAEKARDLFRQAGGNDAKEVRLLQVYADVLKARIESDQKLNEQIEYKY